MINVSISTGFVVPIRRLLLFISSIFRLLEIVHVCSTSFDPWNVRMTSAFFAYERLAIQEKKTIIYERAVVLISHLTTLLLRNLIIHIHVSLTIWQITFITKECQRTCMSSYSTGSMKKNFYSFWICQKKNLIEFLYIFIKVVYGNSSNAILPTIPRADKAMNIHLSCQFNWIFHCY